MKKIFLSFTVFSVIGSCSTDNDNNNEQEISPIIGTWNQYKGEEHTSFNNKVKVHYPEGCESENTFEFNQTHLNTVGYALSKGACVPSEAYNTQYTYDKTSKKLWYKDNNSNAVIVSKLTPTEMVTEDRTEDRDDDGIKDLVIRYFRKIK